MSCPYEILDSKSTPKPTLVHGKVVKEKLKITPMLYEYKDESKTIWICWDPVTEKDGETFYGYSMMFGDTPEEAYANAMENVSNFPISLHELKSWWDQEAAESSL